MKTFIAILAFAMVGLSANAASYFSKGATYTGTNVATAITPAGGQAVVTFLSVKHNTTSAAYSIWTAGAPFIITAAAAAGQSNIVSATIGLAAGNNIVIRDVSADVYQWAIIWATNSTGIQITNDNHAAALTPSLVAGDQFYVMTEQYTETVGSTAKTIGNETVLFASPNQERPVLFKLVTGGATTNGSMIVSGRNL